MKPYATKPGSRFLPDGLLTSIALLAVGVVLIVTTSWSASLLDENGNFQCDPDGKVIFPSEDANYGWRFEYLFSITVAWGDYSQRTAKLIDICWDLFVGRGGQLLLSYLAFRTFRRAFISSMERRTWRIPVLTCHMLDPVSALSLWAAIKDMTQPSRPYQPLGQHLDNSHSADKRGQLQSRPRLLYAVVPVVAYILSFTTIVSAMTGYRAHMEPAYRYSNGATLPLNRAKPVYPIQIRDWNKYPNDTRGRTLYSSNGSPCEDFQSGSTEGAVLQPDARCFDAWLEYRETLSDCKNLSSHGTLADRLMSLPTSPGNNTVLGDAKIADDSLLDFTMPDFMPPLVTTAKIIDQGTCRKNKSASLASIDWIEYDDGYYHLTTSNITFEKSTWNMRMPPADVVDWTDSDYELYEDTPFYFGRWFGVRTSTGEKLLSTYELQDTYQDKSLCQSTKRYQWGFSSLLVFLFAITTTSTGAILLAMNANVWKRTNTCSLGVTFSTYRDILDLAGEIKAELGDDAEDMSVKTLDDRITSNVGSVKISKESLPSSDTGAGENIPLDQVSRETLPGPSPRYA